MDNQEITQYRLYNQQIARHKFRKPGEVVSWLGAVQAQDYPQAKWSVGLRLPGAVDSDVEKALADRIIVRTWPMRHTLHFVDIRDVKWMLSLYPDEKIPKVMLENGLTESRVNEGMRLIVRAFEGEDQIQRNELHKFMQKNGSPVFRNNFARAHVIRRAGREGLICYGPVQGKQHTFVLLDEWAKKAKKLSKERALAVLVKRYFTSHGPASIKDFCWWSGLKVSDAMTGLDASSGSLINEDIDGKEYWMPKSMPDPNSIGKSAYLLPGFDEYIISYADRSAFLEKEHVKRVYGATTLIFYPTIVINGKVAGLWKRTMSRGKTTIELKPFTPLNKIEKEMVNEATEKYRAFAGPI